MAKQTTREELAECDLEFIAAGQDKTGDGKITNADMATDAQKKQAQQNIVKFFNQGKRPN
jgi:hypothetical protein